jgi:hypothetical protein
MKQKHYGVDCNSDLVTIVDMKHSLWVNVIISLTQFPFLLDFVHHVKLFKTQRFGSRLCYLL